MLDRLVAMDRYVCVHGHFYQPPRENPWLEIVEYQPSADPYHDWNERITAECYGPNTAARILDAEGRIADIVSNYARISFNVGPTLLNWMSQSAPDIYGAILAADRESRSRFSGHGAAIAQAYNHMILPLANERDRRTQVLWGIRDFEHRFGREPEGMWLPETAVDLSTLDLLTALGVRFTILSPHQAGAIRALGESAWVDVAGGTIDPTMAYRQLLPSGRTIDLFFYDGPISRAVAFEGLLSSGGKFAERLIGSFSETRRRPQLVHIANDGESYGHHHRHGDMALADALDQIEHKGLARLTVYGEYLDRYPPTHEVRIVANTAWSCIHGLDRWRADCGCSSGVAGWNQQWRAPLRAALDELRDTLAPLYEEKAAEYFQDPWRARDEYIDVILDRSEENIRRFLNERATRDLGRAETTTALQLLELQRHCLLMYTSCGWFFDDISGIEAVQNLQYAGRAIQLGRILFGDDGVEDRFRRSLRDARSNVPVHRNGMTVYDRFVKPAVVGIIEAGAHFAVGSLFEEGVPGQSQYRYRFELEDHRVRQQGAARAAVGRATVTSEITLATLQISFGVIHFGDHNLVAGVRPYPGDAAYESMAEELTRAFDTAEFAEVIRLLDRFFEGRTFSFKALFPDEQRRILGPIMERIAEEAEGEARQVYERHAPLVAFFRDISVPLPTSLRVMVQLVLNADLRRQFENGALDLTRIRDLLDEVNRTGVTLETEQLDRLVEETVERCGLAVQQDPGNPSLMQKLDQAVLAAQMFPFPVDLWRVENIYWEILHSVYVKVHPRALDGDPTASAWDTLFMALGKRLRMRLPD